MHVSHTQRHPLQLEGLAFVDFMATFNEITAPVLVAAKTPQDYNVAEGNSRDPPSWKSFRCPWVDDCPQTALWPGYFCEIHTRTTSSTVAAGGWPVVSPFTSFDAMPQVPRFARTPRTKARTFAVHVDNDVIATMSAEHASELSALQALGDENVIVDISDEAWRQLFACGPPQSVNSAVMLPGLSR